MSGASRERLARIAAAAGYPPSLLSVIAEATLPRYQAGEQLDDPQIEQVAQAVEVLAQAGRTAENLHVLIAEYLDRDACAWRERFWAQTVRTANVRYSHPEHYGLSPCESDPARLAQHAPPPACTHARAATAPTTRTENHMTRLTAAPADASASAVGPPTAAELAARIQVPRRLPVRYDGQLMRHLSNSSYTRFLLCPEDWRRHYLLGERTPPSGAMFLGGRVDDAVSTYYLRILEHHDRLTPDQVKDAYREHWQRELAGEEDKLGIDWGPELSEAATFEMGLAAIELTLAELVPKLGQPTAVQRKLEFALAPGLEWTIQCYLDLETLQPDGSSLHAAVVDYKIKGSPLSQQRADHDPQAGLYLAARWLDGAPASGFSFAQIAKPGKQRKQMSASFITTHRTTGQLRGSLARIALAASQIVTYYERFGPDQPWGFADPSGWKCSPRYCSHWRACPGGRGL